MPMHLKLVDLLENIGEISLAHFFLGVAAFSAMFFGVILLGLVTDMSWVAVVLIVCTPFILTLAVIWSVSEIKRLNR